MRRTRNVTVQRSWVPFPADPPPALVPGGTLRTTTFASNMQKANQSGGGRTVAPSSPRRLASELLSGEGAPAGQMTRLHRLERTFVSPRASACRSIITRVPPNGFFKANLRQRRLRIPTQILSIKPFSPPGRLSRRRRMTPYIYTMLLS